MIQNINLTLLLRLAVHLCTLLSVFHRENTHWS